MNSCKEIMELRGKGENMKKTNPFVIKLFFTGNSKRIDKHRDFRRSACLTKYQQ